MERVSGPDTAVSRRVRRLGVIAIAAVALVVGGCTSGDAGGRGTAGGSGAVSPSGDGTGTTTEEQFSTPPQEGTTATSPATRGGGRGTPAIRVASLPVGGGSDNLDDDGTLQCAHVTWIATRALIPPGVAVELTGYVFSPPVFEALRGGCGTGLPDCWGYIVRAGQESCDLLVRATGGDGGDNPLVGLSGLVYCPEGGLPTCARFIEAIATEQDRAVNLNSPQVAPQTTPTDTPTGPAPSPSSEPQTGSGSGETTGTMGTTPGEGSGEGDPALPPSGSATDAPGTSGPAGG